MGEHRRMKMPGIYPVTSEDFLRCSPDALLPETEQSLKRKRQPVIQNNEYGKDGRTVSGRGKAYSKEPKNHGENLIFQHPCAMINPMNGEVCVFAFSCGRASPD